MSVPVKKQAKKRKSQVPVALVYFATLMLFIAVFGLIASFIIDKLNELNDPKPVNNKAPVASFNLLYAHVNSKNVLAEMSVVRVSPETNKVPRSTSRSCATSRNAGASRWPPCWVL